MKKLTRERGISATFFTTRMLEVQKATDQAIHEVDASLAAKEKEIMQV